MIANKQHIFFSFTKKNFLLYDMQFDTFVYSLNLKFKNNPL